MVEDSKFLFEEEKVSKAIMALAVPSIISQLINVIYNIADTYFVGQIGDPAQVATVHVCMAAFVMLNAIASLFGIGGASLIARSNGVGKREIARDAFAFAVWGALIVGLLYSMSFYFLRRVLLPFMGANDEIYPFAFQYVFWTVTIGGIPTIMNVTLAHLIRAEGASKAAGFGVAMGGALNIILDPIFVFSLKLGLRGAAIATMISNLAATVFFIIYIHRNNEQYQFELFPAKRSLSPEIVREVLMVGLPSCVMTLMSTASNIIMTRQLRNYSTIAIAGIGLAKKIDMFAFALAQGLNQGVLPLFAYCYAAKKGDRFHKAVRCTVIAGVLMGVIMLTMLYAGSTSIVRWFIDDAETVDVAGKFLRIICLICPTTSINFFVITLFQAVGKKKPALVLSLLRKGIVDIPIMFALQPVLGVFGVIWAIPMADWTDCVVSIILAVIFLKGLKNEMKAL